MLDREGDESILTFCVFIVCLYIFTYVTPESEDKVIEIKHDTTHRSCYVLYVGTSN